MAIEENKALMTRFIEEVWNNGNLDVADEIFAPQATTPGIPLPPGPEGAKVIARTFRSAFPDFHITIEDLVGDGERVAARFTQTGTHQGVFMGAAPTGRPIRVTEIAVIRVIDGKVMESWYETDTMTLYQQVGLIPQQV